MRLVWNAGVAITITTLLTAAAVGAGPNWPARADAPHPATEAVTGMPHRHYAGLAGHFHAANLTGDGKLTLRQAERAGWNRVARHFSDIDAAGKGFVTEEEIHAYNVAHHRGRKAGAVS